MVKTLLICRDLTILHFNFENIQAYASSLTPSQLDLHAMGHTDHDPGDAMYVPWDVPIATKESKSTVHKDINHGSRNICSH